MAAPPPKLHPLLPRLLLLLLRCACAGGSGGAGSGARHVATPSLDWDSLLQAHLRVEHLEADEADAPDHEEDSRAKADEADAPDHEEDSRAKAPAAKAAKPPGRKVHRTKAPKARLPGREALRAKAAAAVAGLSGREALRAEVARALDAFRLKVSARLGAYRSSNRSSHFCSDLCEEAFVEGCFSVVLLNDKAWMGPVTPQGAYDWCRPGIDMDEMDEHYQGLGCSQYCVWRDPDLTELHNHYLEEHPRPDMLSCEDTCEASFEYGCVEEKRSLQVPNATERCREEMLMNESSWVTLGGCWEDCKPTKRMLDLEEEEEEKLCVPSCEARFVGFCVPGMQQISPNASRTSWWEFCRKGVDRGDNPNLLAAGCRKNCLSTSKMLEIKQEPCSDMCQLAFVHICMAGFKTTNPELKPADRYRRCRLRLDTNTSTSLIYAGCKPRCGTAPYMLREFVEPETTNTTGAAMSAWRMTIAQASTTAATTADEPLVSVTKPAYARPPNSTAAGCSETCEAVFAFQCVPSSKGLFNMSGVEAVAFCRRMIDEGWGVMAGPGQCELGCQVTGFVIEVLNKTWEEEAEEAKEASGATPPSTTTSTTMWQAPGQECGSACEASFIQQCVQGYRYIADYTALNAYAACRRQVDTRTGLMGGNGLCYPECKSTAAMLASSTEVYWRTTTTSTTTVETTTADQSQPDTTSTAAVGTATSAPVTTTAQASVTTGAATEGPLVSVTKPANAPPPNSTAASCSGNCVVVFATQCVPWSEALFNMSGVEAVAFCRRMIDEGWGVMAKPEVQCELGCRVMDFVIEELNKTREEEAKEAAEEQARIGNSSTTIFGATTSSTTTSTTMSQAPGEECSYPCQELFIQHCVQGYRYIADYTALNAYAACRRQVDTRTGLMGGNGLCYPECKSTAAMLASSMEVYWRTTTTSTTTVETTTSDQSQPDTTSAAAVGTASAPATTTAQASATAAATAEGPLVSVTKPANAPPPNATAATCHHKCADQFVYQCGPWSRALFNMSGVEAFNLCRRMLEEGWGMLMRPEFHCEIGCRIPEWVVEEVNKTREQEAQEQAAWPQWIHDSSTAAPGAPTTTSSSTTTSTTRSQAPGEECESLCEEDFIRCVGGIRFVVDCTAAAAYDACRRQVDTRTGFLGDLGHCYPKCTSTVVMKATSSEAYWNITTTSTTTVETTTTEQSQASTTATATADWPLVSVTKPASIPLPNLTAGYCSDQCQAVFFIYCVPICKEQFDMSGTEAFTLCRREIDEGWGLMAKPEAECEPGCWSGEGMLNTNKTREEEAAEEEEARDHQEASTTTIYGATTTPSPTSTTRRQVPGEACDVDCEDRFHNCMRTYTIVVAYEAAAAYTACRRQIDTRTGLMGKDDSTCYPGCKSTDEMLASSREVYWNTTTTTILRTTMMTTSTTTIAKTTTKPDTTSTAAVGTAPSAPATTAAQPDTTSTAAVGTAPSAPATTAAQPDTTSTAAVSTATSAPATTAAQPDTTSTAAVSTATSAPATTAAQAPKPTDCSEPCQAAFVFLCVPLTKETFNVSSQKAYFLCRWMIQDGWGMMARPGYHCTLGCGSTPWMDSANVTLEEEKQREEEHQRQLHNTTTKPGATTPSTTTATTTTRAHKAPGAVCEKACEGEFIDVCVKRTMFILNHTAHDAYLGCRVQIDNQTGILGVHGVCSPKCNSTPAMLDARREDYWSPTTATATTTTSTSTGDTTARPAVEDNLPVEWLVRAGSFLENVRTVPPEDIEMSVLDNKGAPPGKHPWFFSSPIDEPQGARPAWGFQAAISRSVYEAAAQELTLLDYMRKLVLCMVYISVSTLLIRFNKLMMQEDHFPHAMALSALHTLITTICCSAIYLAAPGAMPAMERTRGSRLELMKWFVPIGLLFAATLFGSNQAYLYCSVTFLQFMKEANVIIVFTISCFVGLQMCSRVRVFVIGWIIAGASISVSGEVDFAWMGFAFQAVSQLAECTRNVMGEYLLSGRKFDALTYNMFLAPICFVVLVTATCFSWDSRIPTDFAAWWHLLLLNGLVAFSLNFLVASVIKECSAVGFVLCGLCKDIVIVIISSAAFQEQVTRRQGGAFLMTLLGILFWSLMKSHPRCLPVRAAEAALCVPADPGEEKALLPAGAKLAGDTA